jgi:hypothetical protein
MSALGSTCSYCRCRECRFPIVHATASTGAFVRALVEDEDAGKRLLAYDNYLSVGEVVEMWSRVVDQEVGFVQVSSEVMHKWFGIPIEVLDGPAFVSKFGYMGRPIKCCSRVDEDYLKTIYPHETEI